MKPSLLVNIVLILFGGQAGAQTTVSIFPKPTGLTVTLAPAVAATATAAAVRKLVTTTGVTPNWWVSFPSAPARIATPFVNGNTHNNWAGVTFSDGAIKLVERGIGLNGAPMPCTKAYATGTLVTEFDALATPPGFPDAKAPRLSSLASAVLSGTVTATFHPVADAVCAGNGFTPADSITLWNERTNNAVFAYQLKLGDFAGQKDFSMPSVTPQKDGWYATGINGQTGDGGVFGFDDSYPITYGKQLMQVGVPYSYAADILPALEAAITQGAAKYGMDGNLSDWAITGEYLGTSMWGHVRQATSLWSGMSLVETLK